MSSEKMELVITNPAEDGFLRHIEWNYDEVKKAVSKMMADYKGLVYTEETMKQAKEDRAMLNKFKKAIEARRIEIKKKCMEPYEAFEAEVKEITAMIDGPASLIDSQIKAYEEEEKEAKRKKIQEAYKESIGDLEENIPFERFFESRYLNKTCTLKTAIGEVEAKVEKAKADIKTIEKMCSERYQVNAKDVYFKTLDLSKALAEASRLEEMERKLKEEQERKRREEEERKLREEQRRRDLEEMRKAEEERRLQEEQKRREEKTQAEAVVEEPAGEAPEEEAAQPEETKEDKPSGAATVSNDTQVRKPEEPAESAAEMAPQEPEQAPKGEKTYRTKFYAVGTLAQLKGLTEYMKSKGIAYGKVD